MLLAPKDVLSVLQTIIAMALNSLANVCNALQAGSCLKMNADKLAQAEHMLIQTLDGVSNAHANAQHVMEISIHAPLALQDLNLMTEHALRIKE